jgi:chromosome partitioning protein
VANLAGLAGSRGIHVLAIDLDPQARLAGDLGVRHRAQRDDGRAMLDAACDFALLEPIRNVRENVDLVAAGSHTRHLADWMTTSRGEDPTVVLAVREAIAGVRGDYDLILIDTPPAPAVLADAGIHAADALLSPIHPDLSSIEELEHVRRSVDRMTDLDLPTPPMLGVVLFDVHPRRIGLIEEAQQAVDDQASWAGSVFDTSIGSSDRMAHDMRRWGLLAGEYRDRSRGALDSDHARRRLERQGLQDAATRFNQTADAMANDYDRLVIEVLERVAALVPGQPVSRRPLPSI